MWRLLHRDYYMVRYLRGRFDAGNSKKLERTGVSLALESQDARRAIQLYDGLQCGETDYPGQRIKITKLGGGLPAGEEDKQQRSWTAMGLKWECPADRTCSTWALSYFSDCVCSQRDMISFLLGITSIFCWAVAEIPQILLNWRSSDVEGVSLAFIFTWMIGDIFNLLGCWINPGTLPTQFYLAVLYFATTVLLVVQQLWFAWISYRSSSKSAAGSGQSRFDGRPSRHDDDLDGLLSADPTLAMTPATQSLPVLSKRGNLPPLPVAASLPVESYGSPGAHSGSWRQLTLSNSYSTSGTTVSRGLIFASLLIVGVTLNGVSSFKGGQGFKEHGAVSSGGGERRLLYQADEGTEIAQSVGLILGWLMTCIYLTGRLPQVILNWSRDFVIGVSVSTLVFAFLGNATYLGSILVRSVEWTRVKPVLPWVVDILGCLFMDFFVSIPTHLYSKLTY